MGILAVIFLRYKTTLKFNIHNNILHLSRWFIYGVLLAFVAVSLRF